MRAHYPSVRPEWIVCNSFIQHNIIITIQCMHWGIEILPLSAFHFIILQLKGTVWTGCDVQQSTMLSVCSHTLSFRRI